MPPFVNSHRSVHTHARCFCKSIFPQEKTCAAEFEVLKTFTSVVGRSTIIMLLIEVRPNFSGAPHLRSPTPHPNTDFSETQIVSPMINPMAQEYKNKRPFSKQDWHFDAFELRSPVFGIQYYSGNVPHLYRRTRLVLGMNYYVL